MLVGRDVAQLGRFEQLVAAQGPAIGVARTIAARIGQDRALVVRSTALRRRHDALGGLARTSGALPPGAWLQRYGWDGAAVRLAGYHRGRIDVAGALRRSGFGAVRPVDDALQAAGPAGEPFDISARIDAR